MKGRFWLGFQGKQSLLQTPSSTERGDLCFFSPFEIFCASSFEPSPVTSQREDTILLWVAVICLAIGTKQRLWAHFLLPPLHFAMRAGLAIWKLRDAGWRQWRKPCATAATGAAPLLSSGQSGISQDPPQNATPPHFPSALGTATLLRRQGYKPGSCQWAAKNPCVRQEDNFLPWLFPQQDSTEMLCRELFSKLLRTQAFK